ncbi:MAG: iron permease [Sphingomonas sp.]|uniref:cytochrome c/FTR1 family iron permease n=1 Tax=Sphingomonas sp. TaxID=28214 RepID=UPI000DBBE25F|nr:cytochrome c/FTR1 family iron permease [Sphingomonas sp.]PZU79600.1 MAG: iron permease [Sphingomonas sp.]
MNIDRVAANGPVVAIVSRPYVAKSFARVLMQVSRQIVGVLVALLTAIVMLAKPVSAQAASAVQTAWRLLDYVAVDYPEAVKAGQVISPTEYAEMTEFSASARERIAGLTSSSAKGDLVRRATALESLIASKAPADAVGTAARGIAADLIAAYPVPLAPAVPPDFARGQTLFNQNCASCHGMKGDGKGPKSVGLDPPPIAFIDEARARERSTFAFFQVLEQGIDGTSMVSFADRPPQDRWDLALYAGTFAFPASKVAEGERIWKRDAALRGGINMEKLVGMTPAALAADIGEARADAVIAYLRRNPSVVIPEVAGTLALARARLNEAVTAFARGDRRGATNLALSAYLDGFEPVEPMLSARDNALMVRIEGAMGALRAAIAGGRPATTVRDQARTLDTLFGEAETVLAPEQASGASSFFGAFTILLREGLEALLIVVAMLAFLRKAERRDMIPYVHGGWVAALLAGAATWAVATYAVEISGASRELTEGFGSVFAALVLLWVGIWMHGKSNADTWQRYIREKLTTALNARSAWFLFGLSFVVVYREVFETILFYAAIWTGGNGSAVLAGAGAAVAVLAVIAWVMLRYSRTLPIGKFFAYSSALMALLAVVLIGKGFSALQEAGWLPVNPLPGFPRVGILGFYPTTEGITAQAVMIVLLVFGFGLNHRSAGKAAAA